LSNHAARAQLKGAGRRQISKSKSSGFENSAYRPEDRREEHKSADKLAARPIQLKDGIAKYTGFLRANRFHDGLLLRGNSVPGEFLSPHRPQSPLVGFATCPDSPTITSCQSRKYRLNLI
jgi:hypothetical protein